MSIVIDMPGATPEEIDRAVKAAMKVFRGAGLTPIEPADGAFGAV